MGFVVNRFQVDAGWGRWVVCGFAALVASCGRTSSGEGSKITASGAGQSSSGAGASSSAGRGGVQSGGASGIALGGSLTIDDEGGGGVAGTGPVAVPLLDTMLCDNVFERVEQLPDAALVFSGTFDGEPVDVSESADVAEPPAFQVFRFGATHVEAVSFALYVPVGPYDGGFSVSAVDCGKSGQLFLRADEGLRYFQLASAKLHTVTSSIDGFSGLTRGSVFAVWISDDGEQHTLDANFTLHAVMGDARALL